MTSTPVRLVPTLMPPGHWFRIPSKAMFAVNGPAMLPPCEKNQAGPFTCGGGGSCVPPEGAGAGVMDGGVVLPPPPLDAVPCDSGWSPFSPVLHATERSRRVITLVNC